MGEKDSKQSERLAKAVNKHFSIALIMMAAMNGSKNFLRNMPNILFDVPGGKSKFRKRGPKPGAYGSKRYVLENWIQIKKQYVQVPDQIAQYPVNQWRSRILQEVEK